MCIVLAIPGFSSLLRSKYAGMGSVAALLSTAAAAAEEEEEAVSTLDIAILPNISSPSTASTVIGPTEEGAAVSSKADKDQLLLTSKPN